MRQSGLLALFGVTVAAVIVAVAISLGGNGAAINATADRPVLPGLTGNLEQVTHLAVVKGDTKLTLAKKDGAWVVEDKSGYPADAAKVRRVLLGFAALRYAEPKTKKPDLYGRLDVQDPGKKGDDSRLVTLSGDTGQLMGELIVGKRRYDTFGGGNDGVYIRKPGEAQSWLAAGTLDMPNETIDWLDRKLTEIGLDKVKSVSFVAADGAKLTIAREKEGAPLAIEGGLPAGSKLKNPEGLNDAARALAFFDFDDAKPAADMPFPDTGNAQAIYTLLDGVSLTITLMDKDEPPKPDAKPEDKPKKKHWVKIAAAGTGDAAKAADAFNKKFAPWVYAIPDFKANVFGTKLSDLTEPEKQS